METLKCVFFCLIVCISQLCFSVDGSAKDDIQKLKADLFYKYDASVVPLVQLPDALQVQVQLSLSHIVKVDMNNAMLESTGYIIAIWQDPSLTWDPSAYANISKLKVDSEEIWNPEIAQLDMVGEFESSSFAFVEHTGMVTMVTNSELRSFCVSDIFFYPRDIHICTIILFSANYPSSEVRIVPLTDNLDMTNFRRNGVWWLTNTRVHTDTIQITYVNGTKVEINRVVHTVKVRHTASFAIIHKGTPLILIAFITILCHIIPLHSEDRISFSAALFMALVFWMALIADDLPKQSSYTSLLSISMVITLVQSSISVVTSVVLCRLSALDNSTPIPNCLRCFVKYVKYVFMYVSRFCCFCCCYYKCGCKLQSSIELRGSSDGLDEKSNTGAGGALLAKSEVVSRTNKHNSIQLESKVEKVKVELKGSSGGLVEESNTEAECQSTTERGAVSKTNICTHNSIDLESNVGTNRNSNTETRNKPSSENEANHDEITWLVVSNTLDKFVGVCSSAIILINVVILILIAFQPLLVEDQRSIIDQNRLT